MKATRILALSLALIAILAAATFLEAPIRVAPLNSLGTHSSAHTLLSEQLPGRSCQEPPSDPDPPAGCTVVSVTKGDRVFFAGNDDYIHPDQYYWVEPGIGDNYGVVWIGTPDNVQQGVNEMGLAYDANGLPEVAMNPHRERIPWAGGITSPQMHILHECATVEEVIEWVQTHQVYPRMNDQRQFADASGDAVLISPGPDGELVFTRKPAGDGYLVSTNFNVINPTHSYGYPCWRYDRAREILDQLVAGDAPLTVEDAAGVMDAVHVEGGTGWTIATMVADLPNGLVYVYFFYQFDKPVVLNVAEELANPRPPGKLSRLFPAEVQQEGARRYERIQAQGTRCQQAGIGWVVCVLACVVLLVVLSLVRRQPRGLLFWVPVVAVLGPLGLLAWLLAGRRTFFFPPVQPIADWRGTEGGQGRGCWRAALLEAAGDVTPTVVAFVIYLTLVLALPDVMGAQTAQLALILGLPPALGWLVAQGPLLALATKKGCLRTLWERLPSALVAANLGMAGVNAVAVPLLNVSLNACSFFPTPGWSVGILWAVVVGGAVLGGLLLFLYHLWAVKRGLWAWRAAAGEGELRSGTWRALWWWVLLSYLVLAVGLLGGVVLAQVLA